LLRSPWAAKLLIAPPTQNPYSNFLYLKPSPGCPGATLKIWRQSPSLIPSYEYEQTNRHPNKHTQSHSSLKPGVISLIYNVSGKNRTNKKLMERIVVFSLLSHLRKQNVISKQQHGFLAGRSTTSNLLETVHDWTLAIDNRKAVGVTVNETSIPCLVLNCLLSCSLISKEFLALQNAVNKSWWRAVLHKQLDKWSCTGQCSVCYIFISDMPTYLPILPAHEDCIQTISNYTHCCKPTLTAALFKTSCTTFVNGQKWQLSISYTKRSVICTSAMPL